MLVNFNSVTNRSKCPTNITFTQRNVFSCNTNSTLEIHLQRIRIRKMMTVS